MRYHLLSLLTATLAVASFAQNKKHQQPISPELGPVMPPTKDEPTPSVPADGVILSDVLGKDRSINIFAGFTRDFSSITQRLENSGENTTILAPLNSAIMALPRKPWEDPNDYENLGAQAYEGEPGEERAQRNMRRFVEAHIVTASPWKEGEKEKTLDGSEVWWEVDKDGIKTIHPGSIEVSSVASKVGNGEVWILKGVRNYA
jgi:hypothetical protein